MPLHSAKHYNVAELCSISPATYLGNPIVLPGPGAGTSDREDVWGRIGRVHWGEQPGGGRIGSEAGDGRGAEMQCRIVEPALQEGGGSV